MKRGDFVLSSGQKSTYYIDGRLVTLDGEGAHAVAEAILERIGELEKETGRRIDAVGGLAIGADPMAGAVAAVSSVQGRPLRAFIVRKEAKKHGTQKALEGPVREGDTVVVLEDVVSTGASAVVAVEALRAAACRVAAVIALVDREMGGEAEFAKAGVRYLPLFTKSEIV